MKDCVNKMEKMFEFVFLLTFKARIFLKKDKEQKSTSNEVLFSSRAYLYTGSRAIIIGFP